MVGDLARLGWTTVRLVSRAVFWKCKGSLVRLQDDDDGRPERTRLGAGIRDGSCWATWLGQGDVEQGVRTLQLGEVRGPQTCCAAGFEHDGRRRPV